MVKVYAVVLVIGLVGLITIIFGGALAAARQHPPSDPNTILGPGGRMLVGGLVGFGMAGLSAEFAPLDFTWGVSLLLALAGGCAAALWARFASRDVAPE